jgi:hypothetical protein
MSEDRAIYAVPTHLRQREPMAFGLTVGELAKLLVAGFAAARVALSPELPLALRLPAAAVLLVVGTAWALLRIRGHSLEEWVGVAFRYGARPKRRVWRPRVATETELNNPGAADNHDGRGWFEVDRIRLRWIPAQSIVTTTPDRKPEVSPTI